MRCVVCGGGLRAAVRDAAGYTLELLNRLTIENKKENRPAAFTGRTPGTVLGMWPFAEEEEADSNTRAVALAAIALGLAISSFLYLCQRQPATASPTKPSQPSPTAPTRSRSPARSKRSKAGAATPRAVKGLEIDMAMPASGGSRTRRRAA